MVRAHNIRDCWLFKTALNGCIAIVLIVVKE